MRWKGRHRRPQFRDCVECGDTFEVEPGKGLAKTCSPECSHEHRKKYQREFARNHLKANRDSINARRRSNYAENPEPVLERNADWNAENREPINARLRRNYAAKKGAPVRPWRRQSEAANEHVG